MKRVYALYRVSTITQVEKNDIPMQKDSCRNFINTKDDWVLTKEFSEKGISGFKVSAKDRDAIQTIQQDTIEKKFDVLLVFMFDRLGRKDDETPFIVEWFVNNGIEVWSVMEGEQRFDSHVDKLTNYIRYWQASGESIKTSIRTKTRMGQIVQEGRFKGGVAAYGYRLEKLGRINKKNHEVNDIVIDDFEAETVKLIFSKYVNEGYGTHRIATFLTEQGYLNRSGENFVCSTIRNMLKNPLYTGVLRSGDSFSEPFQHLQIIEPALFNKANVITLSRKKENNPTRSIPLTTKSHHLLSGNIYCGHCGGRLVASTAGKNYTRKDGSVVKKRHWRYVCYNKTRHHHKCDGQSGYNSKTIDNVILEVVNDMLSRFKKISVQSFVTSQHEKDISLIRQRLIASEKKKQQYETNLLTLKQEIAFVISGQSEFTTDLLKSAIEGAEEGRLKEIASIESLTEELDNCEDQLNKLKLKHAQLISWESIFDECTIEQKKMIIAQLIRKIVITRGGNIDIEFTISIDQFQGKTTKDTA